MSFRSSSDWLATHYSPLATLIPCSWSPPHHPVCCPRHLQPFPTLFSLRRILPPERKASQHKERLRRELTRTGCKTNQQRPFTHTRFPAPFLLSRCVPCRQTDRSAGRENTAARPHRTPSPDSTAPSSAHAARSIDRPVWRRLLAGFSSAPMSLRGTPVTAFCRSVVFAARIMPDGTVSPRSHRDQLGQILRRDAPERGLVCGRRGRTFDSL